MLHILSNSPFQIDISLLKNFLKKHDELLLLQDGILAALTDVNSLYIVLKSIKIYALEEDVDARGLKKYIVDKVQLINYNQFVHLTVKHVLHMNW